MKHDTCVYGGLLIKASKIAGKGETLETHIKSCRKCRLAISRDFGIIPKRASIWSNEQADRPSAD